MPRTRLDELATLAEEHYGLFTSEQARDSAFTYSIPSRLAQRGGSNESGEASTGYSPTDERGAWREKALDQAKGHLMSMMKLPVETAENGRLAKPTGCLGNQPRALTKARLHPRVRLCGER